MNRKLCCIIVDDEQYALQLLEQHIQSHNDLKLHKSYTDPVLALTDILGGEVCIDIAFLDIDMPCLNGLELAERIKNRVNFIVFTTAFTEHAVRAFQLKATQYLVKPVTELHLIDTICQIKALNSSADYGSYPVINPDKGIYVLAEGIKGHYLRLEITDIILFHAEKNYVHIFTRSGSHIVHTGIQEVSLKLENDPGFMRIHKSFVINLSAIKNIMGNRVKLERELEAQISPQYREQFFGYIQKRVLKKR